MIQWLQKYSGTEVIGENIEKNELKNLRREIKHYKKNMRKKNKKSFFFLTKKKKNHQRIKKESMKK